MIEAVSIKNNFKLPKLPDINKYIPQKKSAEISITDSFIKNGIETAPVLLGTSAVISMAQSKFSHASFKKTLKKNNKKLFVPLWLVSTAATAVFENYITSETNNRNQR